MSRKPSKRQQEILAARAVGHNQRRKKRRRDRICAERMAADPSYIPGAVEAQHRMFGRRKQLRRWCHALILRYDPGRPNSSHDRKAFMKLTKLRSDEELLQELNGNGVSPVVKNLFARAFRERAETLEVKGEKNMNVDIDDWWGKGPEMGCPGHSVAGDESGGEKSGLLGEEGCEEDGEKEGLGLDIGDGEAVGEVWGNLPLRMK